MTKREPVDQNEPRQVTQGIWLDFEADTNVAVIDLEGTDSRERGENAVVFERKSALFALAVAEVLIINLWYITRTTSFIRSTLRRIVVVRRRRVLVVFETPPQAIANVSDLVMLRVGSPFPRNSLFTQDARRRAS